MSEHIQECPSSNTCDCNMGPVHKDGCPQRKKCICNELRAYGERLIAEEDKMIPLIRRNEYERGYERAKSDLRHMVPDAYNDGYFEGYEAGYDSALKNHVCENPCADIPPSNLAYRYYNQHGQGENP